MLRSASTKVRCAAIVVLGLVAFGGCSAWFINKYFGIEAHAFAVRFWPPPTAAQVEVRQLREIAGWFSLDCGHVRRRVEVDRAITCAQGALKTGRRCYVAFDYVGSDSYGVMGLAANSKDAIYEVRTDELGCGEFGCVATTGIARTVDITRCERPTIEETSQGYLTCAAKSGTK